MIALRLLLAAGLMLAIPLLIAGRLFVWHFYAWVGVIWLTAALTYTTLSVKSPGLVKERVKPPSDRDKATRRLVALPFLSMLVLAGLDERHGWTRIPLPLVLTGLGLVAIGFALTGWVLLTNPFASSAVRIQQDRGHAVISTGPYAIVRHPMYLAVFVVCLGTGPALDSWWAGLALLPVIAIFIRRTALEDRMLQRELEGYPAYASRVCWRIIPFVF